MHDLKLAGFRSHTVKPDMHETELNLRKSLTDEEKKKMHL